MSSRHLHIRFLEKDECIPDETNSFEFRNLPFPNSNIIEGIIKKHKILSSSSTDDTKTVYHCEIEGKNGEVFDFLPGDTIGILPSNNRTEVNNLLIRLNLESVADRKCELTSTKKLPKHIPQLTTLRQIFTEFVDIRIPPKKLFLKSLIEFVEDLKEKENLTLICHPKCGTPYVKLISGPHRTLIGILTKFSSCKPPVEVILEHLPPLQPRPYSISSSPLVSKTKFSITFFVEQIQEGMKGVCSGWLEEKILQDNPIHFYFRKPNDFRFPSNPCPIVMIATGTGIAPFYGFCQHLESLKSSEFTSTLFYGSRSPNDCLFYDQLKHYESTGILTKFHPIFSRIGNNDLKYVQHKIEENASEFVDQILNHNATIFICGNLKVIGRSIRESIINNLVKFGHMDSDRAEIMVKEMEMNKKYLTDLWN